MNDKVTRLLLTAQSAIGFAIFYSAKYGNPTFELLTEDIWDCN